MSESQRGKRKHLLLPKEIEKKMPKLYAREAVDDPKVVVKFFSPYSDWTWYAYEGERTEEGDFRFFGLVQGFEEELGYFMLSELETAEVKLFGVAVPAVERDCYFTEAPISNFRKKVKSDFMHKDGEDSRWSAGPEVKKFGKE